MYLAIVLPGGFFLGVFGLAHWCRITWGKAMLIMITEMIGEIAAGMILTSGSGLTTLGS